MQRNNALHQYQQVNVQTGVNGASPHKLVSLLMSGALERMAKAKGYLERNDVENRNRYIGKTVDIIEALRDSLDHKHNPQMTANLERLYEYMTYRLFQANAHNDAKAIDEVSELLGGIYDAWKQLEHQQPAA